MRIKWREKKNHNFSNFYKYYFYLTIFLLILSVLIFSQLSIWNKYKNEFYKRALLNGVYNYVYIPKILFLTGKNIFKKIEKTIVLDINQENLIIIENNRQKKIENPNVDWAQVSGKISLNNENVNTRIRLKGDRPFHYENKEKSSYRFNIKGDNIFNGLKSFSIQKPRARNYVYEWIFHKFAKELDIINLQYEFVKFKINGENLGLYVIEESFSNNLLEKNNRRSGPIFGLEENYSSLDIKNIKLDPYQVNYWSRPENQNVLLAAKKKLKNFFNNKTKIDKVLDLQKWADYFVMCDLLMTHHGVLPKSVKFYYNPISGLFEPIAFDGHKMPAYEYNPVLENLYDIRTLFHRANSNLNSTNYDSTFSDFLKLFFFKNDYTINENFLELYKESIHKIVNKKFLDNFFAKYEKEINFINSKIYLDDFQFDYDTERKKGLGIYYFNKEELYERIKIIDNLNQININQISFEDYKKEIIINNLLLSNNRLKIIKIKCGINDIQLNANIKDGLFIIYKKNFNLDGIKCTNLELRDTKNNNIYYEKINQNLYKKEIVLKKKYNDYFNINGKVLTPKQNTLEINENLIIPENFTVELNSENTILLKNNAFIFSESNWKVIGQYNNPVVFKGEINNFGGGIFINSKKKNIFKNVVFKNLSGPDIYNRLDNGYKITQLSNNNLNQFKYKFIKDENYLNNLNNLIIYGSVNFYKSNVELDNVFFSNISSEDSINIFKSKFKLKDIKFNNVGSDAVDIDFSNGKISNVNFINISNDALDFSGSSVNIKNIKFKNIGDKAISAGEYSDLTIEGLIGENSFIGIANKDGSKVFAENVKFDNIQIPLASYIKKRIYVGGDMKVINYKSINSNNEYLLTNTTNLFIDNIKKKPNIDRDKIIKIIYKN